MRSYTINIIPEYTADPVVHISQYDKHYPIYFTIMDGDAENGRNLKHREQNRREQNARERIIVTDRSALAQALTENEICVIGFQHGAEAGSFFQGTELVLSSFEDLDAVFFRNVLKHFHHLPVYIAETERLVLRESIAEDFDAIFRMSRELTPDATTDAFSGDPEAGPAHAGRQSGTGLPDRQGNERKRICSGGLQGGSGLCLPGA